MSAIQDLVEYYSYMQCKFEEYITQIQEDHDVPDSVLRSILARPEFQDMIMGKEPMREDSTLIKTSEKKGECAGECMAVMKSGARKGEACGKKVSDKSNTGRYCGTHVKQETECQEKKEDHDLEGVVFRLNKFGNWVFGDTGLILQSGEVKKIIGKQLSDGHIYDLEDDDIALCKMRKFKFILNYSKGTVEKTFTVASNSNTLEHTSKIALL